jgi:hypothetical protein
LRTVFSPSAILAEKLTSRLKGGVLKAAEGSGLTS